MILILRCGDYTLLNVFLAIACDSLDQAAALNEVVIIIIVIIIILIIVIVIIIIKMTMKTF